MANYRHQRGCQQAKGPSRREHLAPSVPCLFPRREKRIALGLPAGLARRQVKHGADERADEHFDQGDFGEYQPGQDEPGQQILSQQRQQRRAPVAHEHHHPAGDKKSQDGQLAADELKLIENLVQRRQRLTSTQCAQRNQ